jgi:hypothetical protein
VPRPAILASTWRPCWARSRSPPRPFRIVWRCAFSVMSAMSAAIPSPRDRHERLLPARYHVVHETSYSYESPVSLSRQLLHLTPRDCAWQRCLAHQITVEPEGTQRRRERLQDCFGNPVRELAIEFPHDSLSVRAESTIDVLPHLPADTVALALAGALPQAAAPAYLPERFAGVGVGARRAGLRRSAGSARRQLLPVRVALCARETRVCRLRAGVLDARRPVLEAVQALMSRIYSEFEFDPEATTVATPVLKVLAEKRGVCQDFAHLMLSCLRSQGSRRALRQRLSAHPSATRAAANGRRRRLARLGFGVLPGTRRRQLGGLRPDQQPAARHAAHHARLGARFRRRLAIARHHPRRRRA